MNEEPIYLNYGDAQIEQQAFLNAAANNVESYLSKQPWSNKRKDLFRKAYTDIMSREVTGASNATGIWNVQHKGSQIDLDSLSKKEREMYGEAAYFIQQQMSSIPTKQAAEEEEKKKKENLPLFDNKYFTSQFQGYIGNKEFGGQDWNVNTQWNVLDKPNEDGIRATTNRANKLADMLEGYLQTIKDDEVNWEGSPFTDANDFRTRVQNAISALRTPDTEDDIDTLNKIGLKASDYLSTGADDIVEYDGKQMTRAEALELRDKLQVEEAAKEQAATLPEGHILEISPENEAITPKGKYGDQKISGPAEFTDVEWTRLGAVLGDIVSIIDPEPISAGIIGAGSGIARTVADANEKSRKGESWSFGDYLGAGIDIVTGAIGAIPFLGDAILAGKVIKTLKTLGRSAAWLDVINTSPKMGDIWNNKIMGDESMTVDDWKTVAEFIRGLTAHRQLSKSTAAERKVLEHRGVELPKRHKFLGMEFPGFKEHFAGVDLRGTPKTKVKVEVEGKPKEIEISAKSKAELDEKLNKAGNDVDAKNKAVRKVKEVKQATQGVKPEDVVLVSKKRWRNGKYSRYKNFDDSYTVTRERVRDASKDDFDEWLKTRTTWDKFWNGSNRYLQKLDARYQKVGAYNTSVIDASDPSNQNTVVIDAFTDPLDQNTVYYDTFVNDDFTDPLNQNTVYNTSVIDAFTDPSRKAARTYQNTVERTNNPKGSQKIIKPGTQTEVDMWGKKMGFEWKAQTDSDGNTIKDAYELIRTINGVKSMHKFSGKDASIQAKKLVLKTIEEARIEARKNARSSKTKNDQKLDKIAKELQKLKRTHFVARQGGTLNKDMNTIISEFLSKQK